MVAGKSWAVRAPLLVLLVWIFLAYLRDREYRSIFDGLTLALHEAGHAAFMWFGNELLTTAGGTIFQLALPLLAALYLLFKQKDPFGATVGTFWMGTALVGAGVYAADARAQSLPLVSPFGPVDASNHDWTLMLLRFGRLSRDQEIGGALAAVGLLTMAVSLLAAIWMLVIMAASRASPTKVALYDEGEEQRLDAFLSGRPLQRVPAKRIFKRKKSSSPQVSGEPGPQSAGRARTPASPPVSEEERFRAFLEREGDP